MTADRRAIKLNIDEAKFLEAIDREGDHEIGAGTLTANRRAALVEKVARLLCDWDGYDTDEMQTMSDGTTYVMWQSYSNKATAAVSLIRAEVLEDAAAEIERLRKMLWEVNEQCPEHVPVSLLNQIRAALEYLYKEKPNE
ncbi:MAG: hypothetical protein [Caudoviricetes sp.]|nr:MAG: hypothetical protein [Caudoviricetes sp.]